jgi:quercetin dioxygenase-like cupin family protein
MRTVTANDLATEETLRFITRERNRTEQRRMSSRATTMVSAHAAAPRTLFGLRRSSTHRGNNEAETRPDMEEKMKSDDPIPSAQGVHLAEHVQYAEGSVVSRALVQKPVGSITLFAFDTGQGLNEHTAPYDAFVQVLDGEGELVVGGKSVTAKTGDTVLMPANVPHAVHARQRFKMLLEDPE